MVEWSRQDHDVVDEVSEPAPHDEHESTAVYVDLDALHWVVPLFGAVLGLAVLGMLIVRAIGDDGDPSAGEVAEQAVDTSVPADDQATATPDAAIDEFARHLSSGQVATLDYAFDSGLEVKADYDAITDGLGPHTVMVSAGPVEQLEEVRARSELTIDWTLDDGTRFTTTGRVAAVQIGTDWKADWSPTALERTLAPGDSLLRERVAADRMPILGRNDVELFGLRPVVEIGVLARQAPDIRSLSDTLAELLEIDGDAVLDLISRSPSDQIIPIAQRRPETMDAIRGRLEATPGVVLTETMASLAVYDGLGRGVLGRVGPVTAEILESDPERYQVGDIVGRSGLQARYNDQLTGYPGFRVRIVRRFAVTDGSGTPVPADDPSNVVFVSEPEPGEAIRTTIDYELQKRAEQALQLTDRPSALVAVRPSTGEVLAVANGPFGSPDNGAMTGQYPPGSVFKIVTAYGAMERGANGGTRVDCPAEVEVNGRRFGNADSENGGGGLGDISLTEAFARSCNTAFIQLGQSIQPEDYPALARRFGVGDGYQLGTPAFSGSVPVPSGPVDRAATSFGQGQVVVSPLSMAVMAAAAADGSYRPPLLVLDDTTAVPSPPQTLDAAIVADLQKMMAATVQWGTGKAAGRTPGPPVHGKTGTAQFGPADSLSNHAWFVGYQGDLAFAVLVDGGGAGGSVAAPIAADFLSRVNQ